MRKREFALLVGPSMIVMFGLLVVPLYRTILWSFQEVQYGSPGMFVGLENYSAALTDPRFRRAVVFTVVLTLFVTALWSCWATSSPPWSTSSAGCGQWCWASCWFPMCCPPSSARPPSPGCSTRTSVAWPTCFTSITGTEILWFTDVWPNRIMIILDTVWHLLPFSMLIILAGLQGVPTEIIEAAKIDGATSLKSHLFVIVPTIRGVLFFVTLISIMDVLRTFDQLIPLAPPAVEIGNESIMLYIYNIAFREGSERLGLGSAISVLTILLILMMLTPFIRDTFKEARAAR